MKIVSAQRSSAGNNLAIPPKINWVAIALGCFISGFVGTTGVGGSIILSSALLLLNLNPMHIKGMVTFIVFVGTVMSVFLFYYAGFSDPLNSLSFGICCFFGSIVGNQLIKYIQKRKGSAKTNTMVAVLMFLVILMTLCMMPLTLFIEVKNNNSVFEFGEIC